MEVHLRSGILRLSVAASALSLAVGAGCAGKKPAPKRVEVDPVRERAWEVEKPMPGDRSVRREVPQPPFDDVPLVTQRPPEQRAYVEAYEAVGGLNLDLHYSMDWDLFLRIGQRYPDRFVHIPEPLSMFRVHPDSKSVSKREEIRQENRFVRGQFTTDPRWWRKTKETYYLARVEWKYLTERGRLILKKDSSKA